MELVKRIPVEAGMAGGSTDCAAAFHAMRELYGLDVSDQELMKLGVKLGADVPYCIMAKTALSEGIGEVLTEAAPLPDCFVVVAKPTISVSTKMVYENLHANELQHHPDVAGMVDALKQEICPVWQAAWKMSWRQSQRSFIRRSRRSNRQ